MAGIGFELRRMLRKNTLTGLIQAYAYAGVIGSGPWVFSIIGILLVGIFSASVVVPNFLVTQFQTSVTYLVACSLILTGFVQLAFTRFVSDRLFEKQRDLILPNLHGLLLIVMVFAAVLGSLSLFVVFPGERLLYRMLMLAGFGVMCGVWILAILLSGMKRYRAITILFGGLRADRGSSLAYAALGPGRVVGRVCAGQFCPPHWHVGAGGARIQPPRASDCL